MRNMKANLISSRNTIAAIALLSVATGCSNDEHAHPELVTGEQLFNYHCADCHNENGQGNFLKGVPPARGTYLDSLQIAHKVMSDNPGGSGMPGFPHMSEEEAQKIALYVKSIAVSK